MADIFISYSRKDLEFVFKLYKALSSERHKDIWLDMQDIPPAAKWRQEISDAIDAADNFLFILSPDSAASTECGKELSHAIEQHKKLITLVYRDIDPNTVPKALAELNFIFCRARDDFEHALDILISAMETDLEWVKQHTRLLTRSVEWDHQQRDTSLLLRGDDLESAEGWMARSGTQKPSPTELQGQFILASRQDETARLRLEQKRAEIALKTFYRLTYDIREKLKDIPGTGQIRRYFINGNIEGLNELLEILPEAKVMRELATNYRALAEIMWMEKEFDEAAQAYRSSNTLTQSLVKDDPSDSVYWRDLAAGHMNLGALALRTNPDEALAEYNLALDAAQQAAHLNKDWNGMVTDLQSRVARFRQNQDKIKN